MLKLKLNLARIVVTFLDKAYLRVKIDKGVVEQWTRLIINRESTRGGVDTVGWIKAIKPACTRYMCGQPLNESPGFGFNLIKMDSRRGSNWSSCSVTSLVPICDLD